MKGADVELSFHMNIDFQAGINDTVIGMRCEKTTFILFKIPSKKELYFTQNSLLKNLCAEEPARGLEWNKSQVKVSRFA